jgi:hypothetical protein
MIHRRFLLIGALAAALAATSIVVPAALAGGGHITGSELNEWHKKKSQLVSVELDYVNSIPTNEQACSFIKSDGDAREISAFKRTMKKAGEAAQTDSTDWVPLQKWGQGLEDRAASYQDSGDRRTVRQAGGDIDLFASSGQSALEQVARVDGVLAKLNCAPPDDRKPINLFDRASEGLGKAFDALEGVVKPH